MKLTLIVGLIYILHQQKKDLAKADFDKAITFNPNSGVGYFGRGIIYISNGDKQKAIQDLQKAAQLFKAENNSQFYGTSSKSIKQTTKITPRN